MHIAEGVLSPEILGLGWVATLVGLGVGLKRLDLDKLPETAVLAAGFFTAGLVHVPIGAASAHLTLNGLVGLLLGSAAIPAIFVGLVLQAVLFQFGGIGSLGVNTLVMALPALAVGALARPLLRRGGRAKAGVLAGAGAVLASGSLASAALALSGESLAGAASLVLLAHLPVAAVEGALTAIILGFLAKVQPGLLPPPISPRVEAAGDPAGA